MRERRDRVEEQERDREVGCVASGEDAKNVDDSVAVDRHLAYESN